MNVVSSMAEIDKPGQSTGPEYGSMFLLISYVQDATAREQANSKKSS